MKPKITYFGRGSNDLQLLVKWEKVEGATSYRVAIYNYTYKKWYYYDTTKTELIVDTVKGGREYACRVKAFIDTGYTAKEDQSKYTTPKEKPIKFTFPTKFIAITETFKSSHLGLDFGWNRNYGGANADIYSVFTGKVVWIGRFGTAGNMVKVRYDDKINNCTWYAQYKHLSIFSVKIGQIVKQGQKIGEMGNTGGNYGNHLHFDLVKCPYGYNYSQSTATRKKYSVSPIRYLHKTKSNIVAESSKKYKMLEV